MIRRRNLIGRRSFLLAAAVAIAACLALLVIRSRGRPVPAGLHVSGLSKPGEWRAFGGVWQLRGQTIVNRSDERGAKLITGSEQWSNYRVQADLRMIGHDGDVGLMVRSGDIEQGIDSYDGYYIGLRSLDSGLIIGRADHGWLEGRPVPMPGGVQASIWYRLTVVAVDCKIAASATNLQTGATAWAALEDHPCLRTGKIGLRSMATGGAWKNITVTRATLQDWLSYRSHVSAVEQPRYPEREATYNRIRETTLAQAHLPAKTDPSFSILLPDRPGTPGAVDLLPVSALKTSALPGTTVRVRGVVTLTDPIFLQDSSGGIQLSLPREVPVNLGDEVEVTGTLTRSGYDAAITASSMHLLWDRTLAVPLSISSNQAASGALNGSLVEVRGYLRSRSTRADGFITLSLDDESQSFTAILPNTLDISPYDQWQRGSWLRLNGICLINQPAIAKRSAFVLLLRSPNDIQVLAGPPWWSGARILRLIIPVVLAVIGAIVLYFRVESWKVHGILSERERLAHEIHDTLAQSFAGVGFHLQGVRNLLRTGGAGRKEDLLGKLDLACEIVAQTHREASASIAALHPNADEGRDLLVALEHYAERMLNTEEIPIELCRFGQPRELSLPVRDALFQVGREAITNVVRHSHASKITLSLRYIPKQAVLEVRDDGSGFLPGQTSGFGIETMQRRCAAVHAVLQVSSAPGCGTLVRVVSPYGRRLTMADWCRQLFRKRQPAQRMDPDSVQESQ